MEVFGAPIEISNPAKPHRPTAADWELLSNTGTLKTGSLYGSTENRRRAKADGHGQGKTRSGDGGRTGRDGQFETLEDSGTLLNGLHICKQCGAEFDSKKDYNRSVYLNRRCWHCYADRW